MLKLQPKNILLFSFCIIVFICILLASIIEEEEFRGYYYTAPNGEYDVLLGSVDYEKSIVSFVLCESSGSELHGDFKFREGLVFPSNYWEWLTVKLENQIITEMRKVSIYPRVNVLESEVSPIGE